MTLSAMSASSLSFSVPHRESVAHIVGHFNSDIRWRVFDRAHRSPASRSVWFAGGSWRRVGLPSTSPVPFRAGSEVDERIDPGRILLVCLPGPVAAQALGTHQFRRLPLRRLLLVPLPLAPGQVLLRLHRHWVKAKMRKRALWGGMELITPGMGLARNFPEYRSYKGGFWV